MNDRPCPICRCADRSTLYAASTIDPARLGAFAFASRKLPEYMHLRLVECHRCDLLYASSAPDPQSLARAYHDAAFDSAEEARFAAATYAKLLRRLAVHLPDRRGALDIGTGDGAFLAELLAAGFQDIAGIEPSAAPVAAASPRVRPLIHHGPFRAGELPADSCSLVTCFQTLEHVDDPLALCADALRILKPGGAVLAVVHNRRAVSAMLLGRRSPIFDVEHLQLFTAAGMRNLLGAAGFGRIRTGPILNRYPLQYWARLFPLPAGPKAWLLSALAQSWLGRVPLGLPAGNLYAVGFKPAVASARAAKDRREARP